MSTRRSPIWKYFEINLNELHKANCLTCGAILIRGEAGNPSQFSTSPLISHLKGKHEEEFEKFRKLQSDSKEKQQLDASSSISSDPSFLTSAANSEILATGHRSSTESSCSQPTIAKFLSRRQSWSMDDASAVRIHKAIVFMIAEDEQPISMVEDSGFRKLLHELQPKYQIPSRKYFTDRILPEMFNNLKINIEENLILSDKISFTTDIWTSEFNPVSYMCLTAHWLSPQFSRYSAVLLCEKFEGRHTGFC